MKSGFGIIALMPDDPVKNSVKGAIEAIYKPIESIVKTLAGPAAEEIGLSFRDSVQAWRFKRQVRLFERVKKICDEAGIKPEAVKLSLLFEITERASLEEDDKMQDIWANMLSNAADPRRASLVMTAFPEILKQLCIAEVAFLQRMFDSKGMVLRSDRKSSGEVGEAGFAREVIVKSYHGHPMTPLRSNEKVERLASAYSDNLKRLGLIEVDELASSSEMLGNEGTRQYIPAVKHLQPGTCSLTALGYSFVKACSTPQKQKKEFKN